MPGSRHAHPTGLFIAIMAAASFAAVRAAGVYQWTDGQGVIHFDDSNVLEQQLTYQILNTHRIPAQGEAATPREFVEAVRHRCDVMRDRAAGFRSAKMVEGVDPAGNRYVLTPRQVQIEIAIAERDQSRFCSPGAADRLYREPVPAEPSKPKVIPVESR